MRELQSGNASSLHTASGMHWDCLRPSALVPDFCYINFYYYIYFYFNFYIYFYFYGNGARLLLHQLILLHLLLLLYLLLLLTWNAQDCLRPSALVPDFAAERGHCFC